MFRQSNILGVESRPFDPEHFYEEEEVFVDGEGTQRVKLKHNIIRCVSPNNPLTPPLNR